MENIMEEWRPMVGFEGLYEVSNKGNVESINYHREKRRHPLKKWEDKDGYLFVIPYINGEPHKTLIHRAVAMAFIPNPNNYPFINHKDESRTNNNVENLEWCTAKYNTNYGTCLSRGAEKKWKQVLQFTIDGKLVSSYNSVIEASKITGISQYYISRACRSKSNYSQGFLWKYKDEETKNKCKKRTEEEKNQLVKQKKRLFIYHVGVIQYNLNGEFIKEYASIDDAFIETGINRRAIIENCRGTRNSTHGFVFKYKEDVK